MISGKKPNWEQKKLLQKNKMDPTEWLLIKNNPDTYIFRNRKDDGQTIELMKSK